MKITTIAIDRYGVSDDPVFDRLINTLAQLAGRWRTTKDATVVDQYRQILNTLVLLGYNDELPVDVELPDHLMPEAYVSQF